MAKNNYIIYGLAEDDPIFRDSIKVHLKCKPLSKMAFCANNGFELIHLFNQNKTDLLIVDLFMPVISGLEALKIIRNQNPKIPIIAYGSTFQFDVFQMALRQKINCYCENKVEVIFALADQLIHLKPLQFEAVLERYTSDWTLRSSAEVKELQRKEEIKTHLFNSIDLKIMELTCDGFTAKEIGAQMHLSFRTVDTYIVRVLEKLSLRNKGELVRYAFQHGLCKIHCLSGKSGACIRDSIFDAIIDK